MAGPATELIGRAIDDAKMRGPETVQPNVGRKECIQRNKRPSTTSPKETDSTHYEARVHGSMI